MRRQHRATAIHDLVRRLGSRRQPQVDRARARLSMLGAAAVDALVEALESDDNRVRSQAMPILALIRDPRALEPIEAMLLDRDARMREIAARSLGRFPSARSVAALERLLGGERRGEVRVAAVHALLEQYDGGQADAVRQPLAIMSDDAEDPRVRIAALALLRMLRPSARRAILRRLQESAPSEVSRRAAEMDTPDDPPATSSRTTIRNAVTALAAADYAVWNQAVQRLTAERADVVGPLVREMVRRAHDPEFCNRAGVVLKALGPGRRRTLADALDRVREPLPLRILVEVVGASGEKALVYRLHDVIERLARGASRAESGFDPIQPVRARAHLELARIGSRVAAADLRHWLADADQRLELEMLEALERIGKRDEIPYLLRAWAREDRLGRERIGQVVRSIMKRERIRRADPTFVALGARDRRALATILDAPSLTRSRGGC